MTIRITEAELEHNVREVLRKVRNGDEVLVEESGFGTLAVIHSPKPKAGRDIREAIAIARSIEAEPGYSRSFDESFADDVEDGMNRRRREIKRDLWSE